MAKTYSAGITTAYGAAKRGGYTGTYEEFCSDLAQLADVLSEFLGFSVTVQTLAEGASATASYDDGVLALGIPRGNTGNGIQSIVLNADYTLTVTYTNGNTWTSGSIRGQVGATPHLTIGTVQTLEPGQSATASITGTDENPVLNLGIPKGHAGASDAGGVSYDPEGSYDEGTVGAELQEQNRHLNDLDDEKQDAPSTAGTAGQVLGLDSNLAPVWVNQSGGGGGVSDYTQLTNKPQINGHTLTGNQSAADLGLGTYSKPESGIPKTDLAQDVQASLGKADTALQTAPVQSVAGKTGAVNLGAGDVGFDSSEEYNEGTVGAELSELNRHLSDKQDAPETAGTAGQVLGLDSNLNPAWMDQTGGGGGGMNIVSLSGTQITQVGANNTMYMCGELTELTFTAPSTGITGIRFTSGTTPTVLTISGVTAWMFDFDPTTLEASTTYEINVLNGVGCAGWA